MLIRLWVRTYCSRRKSCPSYSTVLGALLLFVVPALGQGFNLQDFDATATGPWSDVALTTATVPQVPDGAITLDGKPSNSEYGGFAGIEVTPGVNAWILDFPGDRQWDDADDSSFTFWLAHDTDFLYVGVDVKDDVVNSDDTNAQFWRDDAIEIVTDVWNDNYDNNTDSSQDGYGGHVYANYEGRFSRWDDELGEIQGTTFSTAVDDWTYGDSEEDDVFGFGEATETGWNMELRMHKRLFEDPEADIQLVEGTKMGFNIGLDDDDKFGPGTNGSGARSQDLELQYFWANRERYLGWGPEAPFFDAFTEEQIEASFEALYNGTAEDFVDDLDYLSSEHEWGINGAGRLSHGGAGEIIFGGLAADPLDCNGDGAVDAGDLACVAPDTIADTLTRLNLLAGDLNADKTVNFADFLILSGNFNAMDVGYTGGDIDVDGTVAFADFLALSGNFNLSSEGPVAVPEPSGFMLLVINAFWLGCRRRRRRS